MSDDTQRYASMWRFVFDLSALETIDDLTATLKSFSEAHPELHE